MNIRILGCNGGVGEGSGTTSILVNDDIMIDCGTGIASLTLDEMAKIRHIFLTHSHLDHLTGIPFLVDTLFGVTEEPILVHGSATTLAALQQHIFNWVIWPDFAELPSKEQPIMRYEVMECDAFVSVNGIELHSVTMNHVVPTCGYIVKSDGGVFAFSADTTTTDLFWQLLNKEAKIDLLIVEAAFNNGELELCRRAKHYCPSLLAEDLKKLAHKCPVHLTHAKPGERDHIWREMKALVTDRTIVPLLGGEVFQIL